jgi:hypothetical protein
MYAESDVSLCLQREVRQCIFIFTKNVTGFPFKFLVIFNRLSTKEFYR